MKNQAAKGLGGNLNADCLGVPICEGSTHENCQVRGQDGGLEEWNAGVPLRRPCVVLKCVRQCHQKWKAGPDSGAVAHAFSPSVLEEEAGGSL